MRQRRYATGHGEHERDVCAIAARVLVDDAAAALVITLASDAHDEAKDSATLAEHAICAAA